MNDTFKDLSATGKIPVSDGGATGKIPIGGSSFDYTIPTAGTRRAPAQEDNYGQYRAYGASDAQFGSVAVHGAHTAYASGKSSGYSGQRRSSASGASRSGGSSRSYGGSSRSRSGSGSGGYSGGGSRSGGGSGGSRRSSGGASRRNSKKSQQNAVLWGFLLLLLLIAAAVFVLVRSCSGGTGEVVLDPATATYAENVTINGYTVSGMTIDQARTAIAPGIEQDIQKIAITLAGDGFSEVITGEQMQASSDLEVVLVSALTSGAEHSYNTTISFNYDALDQRIMDVNESLSYGATDASFTLTVNDKNKPVLNYIPGQAGMGLDIAATEELVKSALEAGQYTASLTPALTTVEPTVTVDDLKTQVTEIGRYTTAYRNKLASDAIESEQTLVQNRAFNVEKGAALINGITIRPGKTWSFNTTVGDRTEKNGWKQAHGITGGETYNLQYGGGICQVSTTLYNALLVAGIPYDEISRRHHSIPSSYVDLGLDATVDTDHIDLKFKNTTQYPIYIFSYCAVDKNRSRYSDHTVVIYGQALPAGVTYKARSEVLEEILPGEPIITYDKKQTTDYNVVTVEARSGYSVDVYLDKFLNDKLESSTFLYHDDYAAIAEKRTMGTLEPVVETPAPTATPKHVVTPEPDSEDEP